MNPAVTVGALGAGVLPPLLAACYICAQVIGGILGAACCRV